MVDTPRKTFPELTALSAPVVDSDVLALYRSPGPAKRTTVSDLASYVTTTLPTFQTIAAAQSTTILASVKSIQTLGFNANGVGGAEYVRTSLATITAASYPATAYFRSSDRFMPDGSTDATNGGYWLIADPVLFIEQFGALGDNSTDNATAISAALLTAKIRGGCDVTANAGNFRFGSQLRVWQYVKFDLPPGAVLFPTADFDAVRCSGYSRFTGTINVTLVGTYTAAALLYDGADNDVAATATRLHVPTYFDVFVIGSASATVGTACYFKCTTTDARIMGIQGRLKVYGMGTGWKGALTATDGSNFITSCQLDISASECLKVVDMYPGSGGLYHIDQNMIRATAQPRPGTTQTMYVLAGQYNEFDLMAWDWDTVAGTSPYAIEILTGARESQLTTVLDPAYLLNNSTSTSFIIENMLTAAGANYVRAAVVRGWSAAGANLIIDVPNATGGLFCRINGANMLGSGSTRHLDFYGNSGNPATFRNFNAAAQSIDIINATGRLPVINATAPATATSTAASGQQAVTANSFFVSHSTNTWRRYQADGYTVRGDVDVTLTPDTDAVSQVWTAPFTADRAVTLATANVFTGTRFRITRAATATGAFNLNVGTGPLKALAVGTWCEVLFNGSAWILSAYGTL